MNPLNAYRNSVYTTPFHVQLAQLHRFAATLTSKVLHSVEQGDVELARKSIREIEDIIAFLRASLDMTLEASEKADAAYAYYYSMIVRWYVDPTTSVSQSEVDGAIEFWQSWAETWEKVTIR